MGKIIECKAEHVNIRKDHIAMAINFERCGAFLRIKADAFGNLNPKEIKDGLCKAVDRYFEMSR